jgi:ABC-type nitrate/sulfonate/bicarbonate transport system substrate-binding protein
MSARRAALALLLAFVAATAVACGDDDRATPPGDATATGAAASATPTPRRLTFMAGFRPQANLPFVAAYVAQAKGYFAAEGLDVTIRHSSGDEHLKLLLAGEIDVTTATGAQALRRRADALPVRAIALFGQRGDQGFVTRADSGIESPADFKGRSVGFKSGVVPAELKALLAGAGLSERDVRLQAVGFDPRVFIERGVDVYPVFLGNEPFAIRKTGLAIRVFDPADYGVATLGLTYLVHDDTLARDRELLRRFLRATLRGAAYAAANVEDAVAITLRYADGADPAQQRYLLETDLAAARRANGFGRADAAQWTALEQLLLRTGVLERSAGGAAVFDGSLVDQLYDTSGRLLP